MSEIYRVLWAPTAERDLDLILEYLAAEAGVDRALLIYERIRSAVETLRVHPRRCRVVPELREVGITDFRESILPPHRIVFRIDGRTVFLVAVLDDRRDLEELLIERAMGT